MKNINVAVLGDLEFAKELGKKGTSTDFEFYNYKSAEITAAFIVPIAYPDKLQSLTHVLGLADTIILVVKELDKTLGEFIIAIDLLDFKNGIIILDEYAEKERFLNLVKGTVLETFSIVDKNPQEVYSKLMTTEIRKSDVEKSDVEYVIIDSVFNVKSVGTVVLGVSHGNFAIHDELQVYPTEKITLIKSIQIHDKDVKTTAPGDRVGFVLKGVSVNEINRGCMLAKPGTLEVNDVLTANFNKSNYFKDPIEIGTRVNVAVGLQYRPSVVEKLEGNKIVLKIDKKVVYVKGQKFLILNQDKKIRIVGVGIL